MKDGLCSERSITELSHWKRDRFVTPQVLWIDRKSPAEVTVSRHVSLSFIAERRRETGRLVSRGLEQMDVRSGELTAKIRTDTLEVLAGNLPRREQRLVLAWAELRASELRENWRRARVGEILQRIEPLR